MLICHLTGRSSRQGEKGSKVSREDSGQINDRRNDNAVDVLEMFKRLRAALRKVNGLLYDHTANILYKMKDTVSSFKIAYSM